jgi:hypothetical protein
MVRVGPLCEVFRAERAHPVLGGELPHDGVGLPEHETAVGDCRHPSVGVQPKVLRFTVAAERTADIDVPIGIP